MSDQTANNPWAAQTPATPPAAAGKPEPWLQLVMMTIAQAATRNLAGQPTVDTTIAVTTRTDGWNVTYTEA